MATRKRTGGKMKYKKGDQYLLPTFEQLVGWGWKPVYDPNTFEPTLQHWINSHKCNIYISCEMMKLLGTVITIKDGGSHFGSYLDKLSYFWPLGLFDKQRGEVVVAGVQCDCEEGMTPIDGYIICKHCGNNIREI